MRRLTAFLLVAGLLAPGIVLGGICCHAGESETPALLQAACCCPEEAGCGLSAKACEPAALHERQALPARLAGGSSSAGLHGALAAFSPVTIRSWWTRRVRLASTDPPKSFQPGISPPLRL